MTLRKQVLAFLAGAVLLAQEICSLPTLRADDVPPKYRETVKRGLQFLAKSQSQDGSWQDGKGKQPVAVTGLAGLALLMEGSSTREGDYSKNILKAVDWLTAKSEKQGKHDGLIYSGLEGDMDRCMLDHAYAALFLACVYGNEDNRFRRNTLKDVLERSVKYVGSVQTQNGGWSRSGGANVKAEVEATLLQLQALQACRQEGIPVPKDMIAKSRDFLEKELSQPIDEKLDMRRPAYKRRPAQIAAALAMQVPLKMDLRKEWFVRCQQAFLNNGKVAASDQFTLFYFSQAVYQLGDNGWAALFGPGKEQVTWGGYRTILFDGLQKSQNADGTWAGFDGWLTGPVYSTAVFCMMMQLDKGAVPFFQRPN